MITNQVFFPKKQQYSGKLLKNITQKNNIFLENHAKFSINSRFFSKLKGNFLGENPYFPKNVQMMSALNSRYRKINLPKFARKRLKKLFVNGTIENMSEGALKENIA